MKLIWLALYAVSVVAVLVATTFSVPDIYVVAKPLLMISLLLYFIAASQGYPGWRKFVGFALVFSWAGDVFLMQDGMFAAGLVSFLIAHIFYIITYQKTGARQAAFRPWNLAGFAAAGAAIIWVLYPGLGEMLVPVVIYMLVLLTMGVRAHQRKGATSAASFRLVAAGALLFVLSDCLIAINKFAFEVPAERLLVMSTYMAAQFLIVQGLLRHEKYSA